MADSQIGILCVTQDNIHSDWILFEAGALSKSLEKSHVCPILFGISNTDLSGPLKQFQTTEFEKSDFHKLINVINNRLGEKKLPQKTLEVVFDKWWPDLESGINNILTTIDEPDTPIRSDRELLEEILQLSRLTSRQQIRPNLAPGAIQELLESFISLHNEQAAEQGDHQRCLDWLQRMQKPIGYISSRHKGVSEEIDNLIENLRDLSFSVQEGISEDDVPF